MPASSTAVDHPELLARRGSIRRIHIVGGSGTGKSMLGRRLGAALGVPVHHLDELARTADQTALRPIEERQTVISRIAAGDGWVTEGIHTGWNDELFRAADVILWLDDTSRGTATVRVLQRTARGWVSESRRRGLRGLIRPRSYALQLRHLIRAMTQIRRYDSLGSPEPESREATVNQLRPYRAKVFRCQRPSDRDDFLSALAPPR